MTDVKKEMFIEWQKKDPYCIQIQEGLDSGKHKKGEIYDNQDGILIRYLVEDGNKFEAFIVPKELTPSMITEAMIKMAQRCEPYIHAAEKIVFLGENETTDFQTHTELPGMSQEKPTENRVQKTHFRCTKYANALHQYGSDWTLPRNG